MNEGKDRRKGCQDTITYFIDESYGFHVLTSVRLELPFAASVDQMELRHSWHCLSKDDLGHGCSYTVIHLSCVHHWFCMY